MMTILLASHMTILLARHMMTHLPEPVSEQDIMEMFRSLSKTFQMHINFVNLSKSPSMNFQDQNLIIWTLIFSFADKNKDGQISYDEFLIMITPVR